MQKGYSKEIAEEVVPFLSFEAQSEMEAELGGKGDCNDLPTHRQKIRRE